MINNYKKLVFLGVIILVMAGIVYYIYFSGRDKNSDLVANPETSESPTPTLTPGISPSLSPFPSLTPEPFLGLHGIKAPATCQVSGEIDFSDKGTFASKNSKFSWQNVDSQGRLIFWHITPKDDLKIGPNLFGNLDIPDGQYENMTISLPENPISKTYLLTASITYGQIIQGDVKVKETNCTGQAKVNLNY